MIVPEFDSHTSAIGITEPVMAVGVSRFDIGESLYTQNSTGNTEARGLREYKAKVRIRIYVPFSGGAKKAFEMADWIYTVLMRPAFHYKLGEINFETAEYDSQTESIRLTTFYTVNGTL